jgi:FkbM family methyltransferase
LLQYLSRLYWTARERFQNRRIYGSSIDVTKAFYLMATTHDRPPKPPRFLRSLRLTLRDLPGSVYSSCQVYLRRRDSDILVFREIFEGGEYRPIERWSLPPDATILDLGGNIGLASLYFESVLPQARIVAVEPDRANCHMIRRNCQAMIRDGRLRVLEAFVAATDGSAGINRNARSWALRMAGVEGPESEQIRCVSMPSLIRESGFERIDLLKCDVEGAEAQIFVHCRDWMHRVSHLIVETHAPYRNSDLHQHLRDAGWEFDLLQDDQGKKVGMSFLRRRSEAVNAANGE